jgi:glycosyltransferase involved in cell wall biosynthesis
MKLSVIIPCKNEVGTLELLLESLMAQTRPADEVIVVDSHSIDGTADIAKSYQDKLPLKIITAKEKGATAAKNEGAREATGELLLFTDADVRLPDNLIEKTFEQIEKRHLSVGGYAQHMDTESAGLRTGSRLMNGYVRTMSFTPWPIFFSCFFVTKKLHEKINGFDPQLWIMEDYDYAYRARKTGAKFGLVRGTHFIASARRFEEGEGHSILRAIYAEAYRYTHGMRLTKPLFKYDMGGQKQPKKGSKK